MRPGFVGVGREVGSHGVRDSNFNIIISRNREVVVNDDGKI